MRTARWSDVSGERRPHDTCSKNARKTSLWWVWCTRVNKRDTRMEGATPSLKRASEHVVDGTTYSDCPANSKMAHLPTPSGMEACITSNPWVRSFFGVGRTRHASIVVRCSARANVDLPTLPSPQRKSLTRSSGTGFTLCIWSTAKSITSRISKLPMEMASPGGVTKF